MTDVETLTPEAAAVEVAALNADKDGPLFDPGHPKHLDTLDRLQVALTAQDAPSVEGQAPDLAGLMEDAMPVDGLAKQADVRRHYIGEGFASRVAQALGPALKQFGILAALDSSHPKFGQCQWRSKKGPPWRCKKGPLGGCELVP